MIPPPPLKLTKLNRLVLNCIYGMLFKEIKFFSPGRPFTDEYTQSRVVLSGLLLLICFIRKFRFIRTFLNFYFLQNSLSGSMEEAIQTRAEWRFSMVASGAL